MTRIFSASPVHVEHPHSMLPMMWKFPTHSLLNHGFWRGWKKLGGDSSSVAFSEDPPCHHFVRPPRPPFVAQRRRFFSPRRFLRGARRPHEIRWSPARNQGGCRGFTWYPLALDGAGEDLRRSDRAGYAKRFDEIESRRFAFLLGRLRRWFHCAQPQIWWLQLRGERLFVDPCDSDIPWYPYFVLLYP